MKKDCTKQKILWNKLLKLKDIQLILIKLIAVIYVLYKNKYGII